MSKKDKISQKDRPFNSSLFDGLAVIKKQMAEEAALKEKQAKEQAAKELEARKKQAAARGYNLDDKLSDSELWASFNRETKAITHDKRIVSAAPRDLKSIAYVDDDAEVMVQLGNLVNGDVPFYFDNSDEYQSGHVSGVDEKTIRELREGSFPFTDHIDLHGLTAPEAKKELKRFLQVSRQHGQRCVLVVTGRGLNSPDKISVLRSSFPGWVSSGAMGKIVLAFCTALPVDGGPGAFYVLLRRNGQRPFSPIEKEDDDSIAEFAKLFGAD